MTIPLAIVAARRREPQPDEGNENATGAAGRRPDGTGNGHGGIDIDGGSDCRAIVPVLRARAQPHRLPLVVRGWAASHHVHFLMDEDEDGDDDVDRVACRALVLHPTKHKSGGAHHKARAPRASVDSLPSDTLKQIFRFLPAPALCAAEMVCPLWRSIAAQDDAWWASLCQAQFGVSPDAFTPPPDPTKMLYVLQHSSLLSIKRGGSGGSGGRLDNWARFF